MPVKMDCIDLEGQTTNLYCEPYLGSFRIDTTGLLVSVRNPDEAQAALRGGADVIDIKEPSRGALGRADSHVISAISRNVTDRPVTAALGEIDNLDKPPVGPTAIKAGLSGSSEFVWQKRLESLANQTTAGQELVAVAYADWENAQAPEPEQVLEQSARIGLRWLLIDTWGKQGGCVLDLLTESFLRSFIGQCREAGLHVALAGSLPLNRLAEATSLGPELVAIRSAACRGGRLGTVDHELVAAAKEEVEVASIRSVRDDSDS